MNAFLLSDIAFAVGLSAFVLASVRLLTRSGCRFLFFYPKRPFGKRKAEKGNGEKKPPDRKNAGLFLASGFSVLLSAAAYLFGL